MDRDSDWSICCLTTFGTYEEDGFTEVQPVKIYSDKRIREFDEAEARLAKVLGRRSRPKKRDKSARGCASFSMRMCSFPQRSPTARSDSC